MLEGILINNLKIINTKNGFVYHGLKKNDLGFDSFGEIYFSIIKKNAVNGWKLHTKMTMNLLVPYGKVVFCFIDLRKHSSTFKKEYFVELSQKPYKRITVPPNIWFGFKGLGKKKNIIANVSNIIHDKDEVIQKDLKEFKINWGDI